LPLFVVQVSSYERVIKKVIVALPDSIKGMKFDVFFRVDKDKRPITKVFENNNSLFIS